MITILNFKISWGGGEIVAGGGRGREGGNSSPPLCMKPCKVLGDKTFTYNVMTCMHLHPSPCR